MERGRGGAGGQKKWEATFTGQREKLIKILQHFITFVGATKEGFGN